MNIFGTVLTNAAPAANYRGESEQNRMTMQRITRGRLEYAIVSPEAIRNALREILRAYGLPCNRERLHDEEQLAVRFQDYPFPERYVDDFFFGYLVANRKQIPNEIVEKRGLRFKRDSILRTNLAVALEPYRHDTVFTQSPLTMKKDGAPWQNADSSALLHREIAYTAFQYPFALSGDDCLLKDNLPPVEGVCAPDGKTYTTRGEQYADWLRYLLRAISELNGVAGNHARSYFEFAPASIVLRLTDALAAGYDLYAFTPEGALPSVVEQIIHGDLPGEEFILGGRLVRDILTDEEQEALRERKVVLERTSAAALSKAAECLTGKGFLPVGSGVS
jgi:CRISPR-associated protein Cst2